MQITTTQSHIVKTIILVVCGVIATIAIVQMFVWERIEDYRQLVEVQIAEQEGKLASIAETTARGGADAVTESIIRDCSSGDRTRFDELLGTLDRGLSRSELLELERLFGRCGSFFSERKLVMAARLEREVEILEQLHRQMAIIAGDDELEGDRIEKWQAFVAEERKLSTYFSELVRIQDDIITALVSGANPQSEQIVTLLTEARETQESLAIANAQASALRTELSSL